MKDGGPAFPHTRVYADTSGRVHDGISIRDTFAIGALPALIEQFEIIRILDPGARDHVRSLKALSTGAYAIADAMLEARSAPIGRV